MPIAAGETHMLRVGQLGDAIWPHPISRSLRKGASRCGVVGLPSCLPVARGCALQWPRRRLYSRQAHNTSTMTLPPAAANACWNCSCNELSSSICRDDEYDEYSRGGADGPPTRSVLCEISEMACTRATPSATLSAVAFRPSTPSNTVAACARLVEVICTCSSARLVSMPLDKPRRRSSNTRAAATTALPSAASSTHAASSASRVRLLPRAMSRKPTLVRVTLNNLAS